MSWGASECNFNFTCLSFIDLSSQPQYCRNVVLHWHRYIMQSIYLQQVHTVCRMGSADLHQLSWCHLCIHIWGCAESAEGWGQHIPVQHTDMLGGSLIASAVPERGGRGITDLAQPAIGISSQIPAGAAINWYTILLFSTNYNPLAIWRYFYMEK